MNSLSGTCFEGFCFCKQGFYNQLGGRCASKPPPDCTTQGGTCHQNPATCPVGNYPTDQGTSMSCGDLVAAVCCIPNERCLGIGDDLVCCGPTDASDPPICENGWQTCPAGDGPGLKGKAFCG
jgi:hypothetical protein